MSYNEMNNLIARYNEVYSKYTKYIVDSDIRPTDYELINAFEAETGSRDVPIGTEFLWTSSGILRQTLQKLPVDHFLKYTDDPNVFHYAGSEGCVIPHPTKENTVFAIASAPLGAFPDGWDKYGFLELEMPGKITELSQTNALFRMRYLPSTNLLYGFDLFGASGLFSLTLDGSTKTLVYVPADGYIITDYFVTDNYAFYLGTLAGVKTLRRTTLAGAGVTDYAIPALTAAPVTWNAREVFHVDAVNGFVYFTRKDMTEIRRVDFNFVGEVVLSIPISLIRQVYSDARDPYLYFFQNASEVFSSSPWLDDLDTALYRVDLSTFETERRELHDIEYILDVPYNQKYTFGVQGTYPNPFVGESSERFWGVTPYNAGYRDFDLIAETELIGASSTMYVNDIPQTHQHLMIQMALNVTGPTAHLSNVVVDVGENSRGIRLRSITAAAATLSESIYPETLFDITVTDDTQSAVRQAIVQIWIPFYRMAWRKGIIIHSFAHGQLNTSSESNVWSVMTDTTNPITQIGVDTETAEQFNIKSRIKVYGFGIQGEYNYGSLFSNTNG